MFAGREATVKVHALEFWIPLIQDGLSTTYRSCQHNLGQKKPILQRGARFGEVSLREKPMSQDARLLLQFDRLQKQAEMRKARL